MLVLTILKILSVVVIVLIGVAYFTLAERKIMGTIQRRKGPNVVGFQGLLQPLADGLKLFVKESILPSNANKTLFILAPMLTFGLSLIGWVVIPFGESLVLADINVGILYLLAVSALGVYGIILAGWSSNSKYAFLGALRSAAQMVSYEVSIGFILITVVLCSGSFNLSSIVLAQEKVWFCVPHLPMFVLFFISALAETNRHPFDLPEAEAELVSGYNVEYSAMGFALFFLGEYANMLLMSALTAILFLGGWLPLLDIFPFTIIPNSVWFGLKIGGFVVLFIVMRACLPRFRYDQLMSLGWKVFLPFSLGWLILTASVLMSFNWLPN
ncbi:NADH dehydrogenase subunit 1 (mitochondrion) [Nannochloropsis gaditana]|uniref:NADH-ubiquinone oxidoreductase chain 1 n=1 Tax=Nannochloropsis gaditana TaxID=72520 RepID=K9ZXU4_9STRA|nr:NADH dehydrogenase subunit 1 [Nannochloropsis gaditana]AFZ64341.1 NADH dehydrogenase subunit 1 [Nannochloropsis gaditana]AGI49043.1 NADH dehydrogenase subunit 1 [Nannochloropsis gaditana]AHX24897.1 NADH dehydrogenase subunit 1 [Nannochloropsis gaditana]